MSRDRLVIGLDEKRPPSEGEIVVLVPWYLVLGLQVKEHHQYTSGCKRGTSYLSGVSSSTQEITLYHFSFAIHSSCIRYQSCFNRF